MMPRPLLRFELYYSPTPNGWKITTLLAEAGFRPVQLQQSEASGRKRDENEIVFVENDLRPPNYLLVPVDLRAGEQHSSFYRAKVAPSGKMPALRIFHSINSSASASARSKSKEDDGSCSEGSEVEVETVESVFESGAVMLRLAELFPKEIGARFCPAGSPPVKSQVVQWLFWVNANLGPIAGQVSHFLYYAPKITRLEKEKHADPDDHTYALNRYWNVLQECVGVLEKQLGDHRFLLGDCWHDGPTLVDFAAWPWVKPYNRWGRDAAIRGLSERGSEALSLQAGFPRVHAWYEHMKARPGLRKGVDVLRDAARAAQAERDGSDFLKAGGGDDNDSSGVDNLFGGSRLRTSGGKKLSKL